MAASRKDWSHDPSPSSPPIHRSQGQNECKPQLPSSCEIPLSFCMSTLPILPPNLVVVGLANQRELIALAPGPSTLYPPSSLTPNCSAMPITDGRAGGRGRRPIAAGPLANARSIEGVIGQLKDFFGLERHRAKTLGGLLTRLAAKVVAYTCAQRINDSLGRPLRHLADLLI